MKVTVKHCRVIKLHGETFTLRSDRSYDVVRVEGSRVMLKIDSYHYAVIAMTYLKLV